MKINRRKNLSTGPNSTGTDEAKEGEGISQRPDETKQEFKQRVKEESLDFLEMELQDLLLEVDERGKALVQHPSVTHARQYKQALASFLKEALEDSRAIKRLQGTRNVSELKNGEDDKEHVVVEVVDDTTDEMIDIVRSHQEKSRKLAERVGEIRGLLVDLVDQRTSEDE